MSHVLIETAFMSYPQKEQKYHKTGNQRISKLSGFIGGEGILNNEHENYMGEIHI